MHDRDGKPLAVGDKVNVPCTITSTQDAANEDCNVTLVTEEPMGTRAVGDTISLNAKQTVKV
jgi:hypothetical protein